MNDDCIATYISQDLDLSGNKIGKVLGIYRSCFNILWENGEFCTVFLEKHSHSPLGIHTNLSENLDFNELNLSNGDKVQLENMAIKIESIDFSCDLNTANFFCYNKLSLKNPVIQEEVQSKLKFLKEIIVSEGKCTDGMNEVNIFISWLENKFDIQKLPDAHGLLGKAFYKNLGYLVNNLGSDDVSELKACILKIIGCGYGLTPSGDDILCGLGAFLSLYPKKEAIQIEGLFKKTLWEILQGEGEKLTSYVSLAYLKSAIKGSFSQETYELIKGIFDESTLKEFGDKVRKLISRGHSSGTEISFGILIGSYISGINKGY